MTCRRVEKRCNGSCPPRSTGNRTKARSGRALHTKEPPVLSESSTASRHERHDPAFRVAALYCYPVKGCAPVVLTEAVLTRAGLRQDRSFMVTDDRGRCRTQRAHPQLALIQPEISADGTRLVLHFPESASIDIDVDSTGPRGDVNLFGASYRGIDQGDEVAQRLSEALGTASRLVRVPPEHHRITDGHTPGTSGYADSCPIHLLSEASLQGLNRTLRAKDSPALPMSRFRPNIVITGGDGPHAEDTLRRIRIGRAELGYAKPAIRCVVTTVDQALGAKSGPEPLATLATYRRAACGGIAFGTKFAVTSTGTLAIGDPVTVAARGPSEV
ncbi:MAG: MOSC N-terminal beta barrel domain-containing protein [Saccharopolyspora sp.]|nr:MOSC N-terminal beta barrel domain-containing protein [Saccharopolyspora sp.]